MAISFADLKKNRGANSLNALVQEAEKLSPKKYSKEPDPDFWYPAVDKAGNGFAIFRFLPAPKGEAAPWVRMFRYAFKGPNGWYIENSLNTLGKDVEDPIGNANRELWNVGTDAAKAIARSRKRKLEYTSNILVVKDPANPENEGKVFKFKYGAFFMNMILAKFKPDNEHDEKVDIFDMWTGQNMKFRISQDGEFRSYKKSEWDAPSPIADSEEKIEEIWNKCFPLKPIVAPENFKTFEELAARFAKVMGSPTAPERSAGPTQEAREMPTAPPKKGVEEFEEDDDDEDTADFLKRVGKLTK